jgi:hypothetical protein
MSALQIGAAAIGDRPREKLDLLHQSPVRREPIALKRSPTIGRQSSHRGATMPDDWTNVHGGSRRKAMAKLPRDPIGSVGAISLNLSLIDETSDRLQSVRHPPKRNDDHLTIENRNGNLRLNAASRRNKHATPNGRRNRHRRQILMRGMPNEASRINRTSRSQDRRIKRRRRIHPKSIALK